MLLLVLVFFGFIVVAALIDYLILVSKTVWTKKVKPRWKSLTASMLPLG